MTYSTYRDLPTYPVTYDNLLHVYIIYFLIKYLYYSVLRACQVSRNVSKVGRYVGRSHFFKNFSCKTHSYFYSFYTGGTGG